MPEITGGKAPTRPRMRAGFEWLMGLTRAEVDVARDCAGKPWRTAYYVASHDWPVPDPDGITVGEAYAAVAQMAEMDAEAAANA